MMRATDATQNELQALVSEIQAEAWARLGVDQADLAARFEARRKSFRDLAQNHADFRTFNWGVEPAVAAANGLARDVEGLWALQPPTELQDPAAFAWLELIWRYIGIHLPFASEVVTRIMFATAPNGDFNASAIPCGAGGAIIVEEGLIVLARRLCALVTPVLYVNKDDVLLVRTQKELVSLLDRDQTVPIEIAQLFVDYIIDEGIELPPVAPAGVKRTLETRFADTLFQSFIAFVLWHEVLHLESACGNPGVVNKEVMAVDGEKAFAALLEIAGKAGLPLNRDEILKTFASQREELEADTYAMIRAAVYGTRTNTLPGTVTGAMTFMFALETVHRMLAQIQNPELYHLEGRSEVPQLRASAILGGRGHPHPRVRRAEVIDVITELNVSVGRMVGFEAKRLEVLFGYVWPYIETTIAAAGDEVGRRARRWAPLPTAAAAAMVRSLAAR